MILCAAEYLYFVMRQLILDDYVPDEDSFMFRHPKGLQKMPRTHVIIICGGRQKHEAVANM